MKSLILATTLIASIIAGSLTVQAATKADRTDRFDAGKLFDDIANRSGQ